MKQKQRNAQLVEKTDKKETKNKEKQELLWLFLFSPGADPQRNN